MAEAISALECRNRAPESWRSAGSPIRGPHSRGLADFYVGRRVRLMIVTAGGTERENVSVWVIPPFVWIR
jgi:hypothetical protein